MIDINKDGNLLLKIQQKPLQNEWIGFKTEYHDLIRENGTFLPFASIFLCKTLPFTSSVSKTK
jgi:hypothetical protein